MIIPEISQELAWNPIYNAVEERIRLGDKLLMLISPFIKHQALERLLANANLAEDAKVIVRWRPEDILHSVADLSIYPLLAERKLSLHRNENIHLKLYVFESNIAFHSSANLTGRGFGYGNEENVEIGCFLRLSAHDWTQLYALIEQSLLVDDSIYYQFIDYEAVNKGVVQRIPEIELRIPAKPYSIHSLPATETPQALAEYYAVANMDTLDPDLVRRCHHDLGLYGVLPGLNKEELITFLRGVFVKQPFIRDLAAFIKEQKSARFGAVNEWIHNHCSDVPLPYRWEIKENTNILYNWLEYFFDEIRWDVPGARSQIIYWDD